MINRYITFIYVVYEIWKYVHSQVYGTIFLHILPLSKNKKIASYT
jgi:hypothetical protein